MDSKKPEPMTEDQILRIARKAMQEAVSFVESEIMPDRLKSQRYFDGEVDIGHEEGRSKVVATKVRDVTRAVKASLMRVFLSSDKPAQFVPRGPEDVQFAEMATQYIQYKFDEIGGHDLLGDVFHDALLKKVGIAKAYWDEHVEAETYEYQGLNPDQYSLVVNDPEIEVVSAFEKQDDMGNVTYNLRTVRQVTRGELCGESLPPEEFFVDRNAKCLESALLVAHRTEKTVGDLVTDGFKFEDVAELTGIGTGDGGNEEEELERSGYSTMNDDDQTEDPSMNLVAVSEIYMKMDVDGTGIPQMQRIVLGGGNYSKLLEYEAWGPRPFAVFEIDPEPHTFFGRSLADLIMDDQDASTALLRGVLDNIALSNNPQLDVIEDLVNMDEVENNEIGGVCRVLEHGAIQPRAIPFIAGNTLSAIEYYNQQIDEKTGVSRASNGLDPDTLQKATAKAVSITVQEGRAQEELMVRNLAEGGLKQFFKLLLKLAVENAEGETMMQIGGQFVPVDPRAWNTSMNVTVNVGLGTGREEQRAQTLMWSLDRQIGLQQAGSPLVSHTGIRNTLADILAVQGVRNSDRYYQPMDHQTEQMLQQQAQQQAAQQPPQQDPLVQAETIKAQAKQQSDAMSEQLKDDRERDKSDQQLMLDAAKIQGQYGIPIDIEQIKQMQNVQRY